VPNHLWNIVVKELREIFRDPKLVIGMIIVPLLIFPLMGGAIRAGMDAEEKQLARMEIAVMDLDRTEGSYNMSSQLNIVMVNSYLTLQGIDAQNTTSAVSWCMENGFETLVVVPGNFTEAIEDGHSAVIEIYQVLTYYGFSEAVGAQRVTDSVRAFNDLLTAQRLQQSFSNSSYEALLSPAVAHSSSVIRGSIEEADPQIVVTTMLSTTTTMPIVIMLLIIMAGQLAATSVAMEKEQKTLEVLLTLPIKRINILLGKLAGVVVVSLIATLSYVAGFGYYMSSFQTGAGSVDLAAIGLAPDMAGYALMIVSLFLSFIAALSLAVLLAAYTQDVRSAQSLLGILYVPVMMPAVVLMISPIEILPPALQGALYAVPFTYPILAAKALYTHQYGLIAFGIIYQVVFTAFVLYLATRMFSTEKVLTAKLNFGKKKGKKME
jgi:ABC-2 type transport system permease protein